MPPPPPLRTTREWFHSCQLKPLKRPLRDAASPSTGMQGSHCANPASGENLHDTGLGPTHIMGGRTSRLSLPSSACLLKRLTRFSRDGTPEGSQPAFAVRGCPWGGLTLSPRSTTERHSLPPASLPRLFPIGFLCRKPTLAGRQWGYFVHLLDRPGVLGLRLSAGGVSRDRGPKSPAA